MVKEGTFVKLDYSGKTVEGKIFDTTSLEEAKKAGLPCDGVRFGPVLVVAGQNHVLKGLDEALLKAQTGKLQNVKIPVDKAFGERDPDLVRLVPENVFKNQGVRAAPGMVVNLDGRIARVQSVSGGRVRVDFNPELAGQSVEYSFKIVEELTEPQKILAALAADTMHLPAETVSFKDGVCTVRVGPKTAKTAEFVVRKMRFIQMALQYIPELKKIDFTEEYEKPTEKK